MERYDAIVIGGGLLGCFAARNLARFDLRVALLEAREDLCTGISRANTAIVYSGCDTKPGTLKTSMCVRAAQGFLRLCGELGVRYSPCGSIMVSFGERGARILRNKLHLGTENGVRGMKLLTREEIFGIEPNIADGAHSGLYVPGTGTVMPWELCLAAAENAAANGVDIYMNTEVTRIDGAEPGSRDSEFRFRVVRIRVATSRGEFSARYIVNCAGMAADSIFEMVSEPIVRIAPTAGDYYVLDTKAAGHISHVIFHEPEQKGKGLTLVPTVDGNILVGPTERPGDNFRTEAEGLDELRGLVAQVVPSLPIEHIIRSFGAVRPNPQWNAENSEFGIRNSELHMRNAVESKIGIRNLESGDTSINDFCILESYGGSVISFIGVKTPGLTCSNELGMFAAEKAAAFLGASKNPHFDPLCKPHTRLSDMTFEERESFANKSDPIDNRIVCRCRGVSEGEIVDAIHRFPGATTLDGVKRRTGAGSGCCQGGFCAQRVVELLAREMRCAPEEITKDGDGSRLFYEKA